MGGGRGWTHQASGPLSGHRVAEGDWSHKKKLGDKPRNVENYAYWRDFLIVAGTSIRLPVIIGCLV